MTPAFTSRPDVLVIGESVMDIISDGLEELHRPGGSPMNVAVGLARLGHRTELLTQLGDDAEGDAIRQHLTDAGVTIHPGSITAAPTSTAIATLQADGSASYEFTIEWNLAATHVDPPRLLHTGSIGAIVEPGAREVRRIIEQQDHALISFDPNIRPAIMGSRDHVRRLVEGLTAHAHVVKMSDEDTAWLYPGASTRAVLDALIAAGVALAIVTLGADGCALMTPNLFLRLPAVPTTVVDTVGAGDSFTSALLSEILRLDLVETVRAGALSSTQASRLAQSALSAAAITVSRQGAQPPTTDDLADPAQLSGRIG
ncbi:carbohydrate kinase [Leifsonia sp. 2TAF2]|uniref:carbohydrate kinase family protein n=1 Tax=Leifsonia sp. 2TAF2 TaxID=3233009 RepID=UPI003F9A5F98